MLEIVSAVLFLISFTRSLGLLLVSSFLGGAIATHLPHGQPIYQPAFVFFFDLAGHLAPPSANSLTFRGEYTGRKRSGRQ